jgi:hypothetical protein
MVSEKHYTWFHGSTTHGFRETFTHDFIEAFTHDFIEALHMVS